MYQVKDTLRSRVKITFDGRVIKKFRGPKAEERFCNEVAILRFLETKNCPFVPRLLESDTSTLTIMTTSCGSRVEHLDEERLKELFAELEEYGIRHDDPTKENVTYRQQDGRFCIIDFEFASILGEEKKSSLLLTEDSTPLISLRWSGHTDLGRVRANNEDAFLGLAMNAQEVHFLGKVGEASTSCTDYLFAVSDGMGGAKAGEFASRIVVEKITRQLLPYIKKEVDQLPKKFDRILKELFAEIHRALLFLGDSYEECRGMGATLSLCWFRPGILYFGHVGDSRIYHLPKNDGLKQLTEDDTHVGWLFRTGAINEREAKNHPRRNILQKALGAEHQFATPYVGSLVYEPGDRFLLCTDGVTDGLFDEQLFDILKPLETSTASQKLTAEAVQHSGRDNTTAMVIEINSVIMPQSDNSSQPAPSSRHSTKL